ncbi:MAG TPA: hypothetical protein VM914_00930 [Pyrinomonadaceae bacterium]|jgi:hypothetical protein|nr:hypothetical protein [Pyrinomonadaceae bacterium]
MRLGRLRLALLLVTALPLCGCVVETPPSNVSTTNAPAANSNVGESDTRPMPEPSLNASPTPGGSPESANANAAAASEGAAGKLDAYMRAAAQDLTPEQREALGRIPEEARRLLALRGYLRSGGDAMSRWAWSRERIEAYEKSPEYAAALAEVDKVRREFEAANPGYTLRVNTKVRSLDEQLGKWNETESIKRAGEELLARAREEVAVPSYGDDAKASDVRRFENFLRGSTTRATPTLAVPGLSPHGQARAFDFQVMRGAQLIAGTSGVEATWDTAGWTLKLQEAVGRASTKFAGPLASPREPWHYDYRP